MNIYVELTFVLNLSFTREKVFDCEEILALCEESDANLILPAYSLIEAYETLLRRKESFGRIKEDIEKKPKPTESTKYSESELRDLIEMSTYLTNSVDNDLKNFKQVQSRLLNTAELIPLDAKVIEHASQYREEGNRMPAQEAIVFSSVLLHLESAHDELSLFFNRNPRGFGDIDAVAQLRNFNCELVTQFDNGRQMILNLLN